MSPSTFVFIDAAIENYALLASGVSETATVVVLDQTQDGIEQVSAALQAQQTVDSVHIFSHGAPGALQLGTSYLSLDTIDTYDLQPWQQALKNANLLLYGCRLAAEGGDRFLNELHRRTGANIAATATPTGSAAKGGDWHLEQTIGAVEVISVLRSEVMAAYDSVLEFIVPNLLYAVATTTENNVTPSQLRVVDLETGNSPVIAPLLFQTFALARQATTGRLYYIETNGSVTARDPDSTARVAYFDYQTRQNVLVGNTGVALSEGEFVKLAQAQDGRIFGMNSNTSNLYTIAVEGPNAGTATNLGQIRFNGAPLPPGGGDVAFDPNNPNRLFVTVTRPGDLAINQYQLYTVDVSAPALPATLVGDVRLPNGTVLSDVGSGSLAFGQDGFLYLTSDLDGDPQTNNTGLFQVDPATAIVVDADRVRPIARLNDFATLPTPTAQVDLILTKTDDRSTIAPGQTVTYTITVRNPTRGNLANVRLTDFIQGVNGVTWTGEFSGGAPGNLSEFLPGAKSGSGNIDVRFNLGAQATVVYTIRGTVDPNSPIGSTLSNTATVSIPDGMIDPNPGNNTQTDTTLIISATEPDVGREDDNCVPGINRRGNNRNNRLLGDNNINRLIGGNGNDLLRGFDCPDFLSGGRGRDRLRGGSGRDILQGNQGNDKLNGVRGNDRLNGGLGNDFLIGGFGSDSLRGGSGRDRLDGNAGNDRLIGNKGNDLLRGNANDDVLFGRQDNDRLRGNGGNDRLRGNVGDDRLGGARGDDFLHGGRGDDRIFGGRGADQLIGRLGNDFLSAGRGNDFLDGQANNDRLLGLGGRDRLFGRGGRDLIDGGSGADFIFGGRGVDNISGGGGNDTIVGRFNADRLVGGGGRDRFEYRGVGDAGDRIVDFSAKDDLIVMRRIFADPSYGSNRPFRQYIRLEQAGADTNVSLDFNGDRAGGFRQFISLAGVEANTVSGRNFVV